MTKTKPKRIIRGIACECPHDADGFLTGNVHKAHKCKCTSGLQRYRRGRRILWLCDTCHLPGDRAVSITHFPLHITDVLGCGTTDERDSANARLIAAAPRMFQALQRIASVQGHISVDAEWATLPNGEQIDLGKLITAATITP
jgi:hypothetical protein